MGFLKFLFSKAFLKHIAIAFGVAIFIVFLTFEGLKRYTLHGKYIRVPDVTNISELQAKRMLQQKKLRYKVIDSIYTDEFFRGAIVDQMPASGSKVKKNRQIYLVMNATMAEMVLMPKLQDVSIRQAKSILSASGLQVGDIILVPSEYRNLVIAQHYKNRDIPPGERLPKGAKINLLVGKGLGNTKVGVPDLVGKTFEEAKITLAAHSLNLGVLVKDEPLKELPDTGLVWKQRPEPGLSRLREGSSVNLWLTLDSTKLISEIPEEPLF